MLKPITAGRIETVDGQSIATVYAPTILPIVPKGSVFTMDPLDKQIDLRLNWKSALLGPGRFLLTPLLLGLIAFGGLRLLVGLNGRFDLVIRGLIGVAVGARVLVRLWSSAAAPDQLVARRSLGRACVINAEPEILPFELVCDIHNALEDAWRRINKREKLGEWSQMDPREVPREHLDRFYALHRYFAVSEDVERRSDREAAILERIERNEDKLALHATGMGELVGRAAEKGPRTADEEHKTTEERLQDGTPVEARQPAELNPKSPALLETMDLPAGSGQGPDQGDSAPPPDRRGADRRAPKRGRSERPRDQSVADVLRGSALIRAGSERPKAASAARLSPRGARRVYAVAGFLAACTGEVTENERQVLERLRRGLKIPRDEARQLEARAARGEGLKFSQKTNEKAVLEKAIVRLLSADGVFHERARKKLKKLVGPARLSFDALEARIEERLARAAGFALED